MCFNKSRIAKHTFHSRTVRIISNLSFAINGGYSNTHSQLGLGKIQKLKLKLEISLSLNEPPVFTFGICSLLVVIASLPEIARTKAN